MKRSVFIKRTLWSLAGTGLLSGLYAWQVEPFWLEFVHLKMPVKNLPDHLVGKTLMQISDIHIGNRFDYNYIIESFDKARAFAPDFVVYTGDYITADKDEVPFEKLAKVLAKSVQGKIGTIGILGNHDYGKNWKQNEVAVKIAAMLAEHNISVLRNETKEINGLHFIGFDDCWGTNFNAALAMKDFDATKATIVLCHNPDVCDLPIWKDYQGWILSGHTHGGQCKPPFLPPLLLPVKNKRYTAGAFDLNDGRTLYINRALGHLWQIRFNVRPEITIFELQKG
jgi:uncharacterized protein